MQAALASATTFAVGAALPLLAVLLGPKQISAIWVSAISLVVLAALGALYWRASRKGRDLLSSRWFLRVAVLAGPASVAALELGWMVTELGRQPWVVYRRMRVTDAVTLGSGVWITLSAVVAGYAVMTVMAAITLRSMARRWREGEPLDLPTPYSPEPRP